MVDIPMSPSPPKDRSILAVTESGRISLDAPKLKALLLALLTGLAGWQASRVLADDPPTPAVESAAYYEHVKAEDARLSRIEDKLDQILLKLAK